MKPRGVMGLRELMALSDRCCDENQKLKGLQHVAEPRCLKKGILDLRSDGFGFKFIVLRI